MCVCVQQLLLGAALVSYRILKFYFVVVAADVVTCISLSLTTSRLHVA